MCLTFTVVFNLVACYSLMTHRDPELHKWSGVLVGLLKTREDKMLLGSYLHIHKPVLFYILNS